MNATKTWATRIGGAGAGALLVVGATVSPALAAAPAAAPDPLGMTQVTNLTPYAWTLLPMYTGYNVTPPKTVQPGQTAVWSVQGSQAPNPGTVYNFTDSAGGRHAVAVTDVVDSGNETASSTVQATIWNVDQWNTVLGTATDSHTAADPDGVPRHLDALWNTPVTIKIDNSTDPAAAAQILDSELPRAVGEPQYTIPDGEKPTFRATDAVPATGRLINESSEPVKLVKGHETTKGESTSLGEEATASVGTEIFGVAEKVAVSVDHDDDWGSSDSVNVDIDADIDPGNEGWLVQQTEVGTLNGAVQFSTPEGITFQLSNVAISKAGLIDPSGNGVPNGVNYSATEQPIPASDK